MEKKLNDYAQCIKQLLEKERLPFFVEVEDDVEFCIPEGSVRKLKKPVYLSVDEKGYCIFRCFLANKVESFRKKAVLEAMNELNRRYRYISIYLTQYQSVLGTYNMQLYGDKESACEYVVRFLYLFAGIMSECDPRIEKAIWSSTQVDLDDLFEGEIKVTLFDEGGNNE